MTARDRRRGPLRILVPAAAVVPSGVVRAATVLAAAAVVTAPARRRRREAGGPPPADVAPLPGRPRLVTVVGGSMRHGAAQDEPWQLLLAPGQMVLGRARDTDVRLAHPTVSPRHALLELDDQGRAVIRDLGAVNGLCVDGVPVAQAELHDGNRVSLGEMQLVYRVDRVHDDGGRQGGELGESPAAGDWQRD